MRYIRLLLIPIMVLLNGHAAASQDLGKRAQHQPQSGGQATVHLFWTATCPHCASAKAFLESLARHDKSIVLDSHELATDKNSERAFVALTQHFGIHPPAVPLIIVGDQPFVGYGSDDTTGAAIRTAIRNCRRKDCEDVVARVGGQANPAIHTDSQSGKGASPPGQSPLPNTIKLPLLGDVQLSTMSLPVLTVALAAVDGFNPCAMWVLVFLIGLLLGMQDSVRMWTYGAVFLLTSALVYFAFLAAWLNVFLWVGSLGWVRSGIGVFALGVGGYYLWQFVINPSAACPVTSTGGRQKIMTRFKVAVAERSFLLAISGIVVLAIAVNLIELLCSAGIPAVYTQVLALSDLPPAAYYGYLTLYIVVFLVDDAIVFVTAMITLRATGLTAQYARYSHLIGGVVLGGVGFLLLLRPNWLAFT